MRRLLASGVPKRAFVARGGVPAQRVRATIGARSVQDAHLPLGRRVGEISELLAQYPAASPDVKLAVQRRIEALAGGGRQDDRAVVHEAAAGTLRVTVGDALAADLRGRVPKVLDLLAEEAELTRQRTNRLLAGRLGPGTYELAEVLRSTGDLEIEHGDRLAARIAALVREAPAGAAELNLAGLLDDPAPPAAPVLCSADVMVATPALEAYEPGSTPLVLSRLHDAVLLTPWALQFHEEGAACLAERDAAIRRALSGFTVLNVISRRTNGVPPLELPGPVLELGGAAADPRRRRIGLDELYVHSDGRRAVLHAKGMEEPLLLHNGDHDTALHTAFALPRIRVPRLAELSRVPRLTWDNVVISRRRWRLGRASFEALAQAGDDRELLVAMARLREVHELPEAFYAATPRERRSFYVDTRSPALLEGLARLAASADRVTLTEVLPGPEACWLREGERRYAAELRCVYLRPAGRATAPAERAERASATSEEGGARQAGAVTRSGRAPQPARSAVPQPAGAAPQPGDPAPQPSAAVQQSDRAAPQPGNAVQQPGIAMQQPSAAAPQPSAAVQQPGAAGPEPVVPLRRSHGSAGPVQQLQPHGPAHGAGPHPQWFVRQVAGPIRQAHGPAHRAQHSHPYPWPGEGG
ncbi:lantibiotic dehydratase [[Actinomadura] parvosata]|uniref:lantibiotic dehydratase n=1 Tax=[Actinomadura] parvosata TaxID=1955412 RepID=UPI0016488EC2